MTQKIELRIISKKGCIQWGLLGTMVFVCGLLLFVTDPLKYVIKYFSVMRPGSLAESLWETIPVQVINKVYVLNITNSERFLSGEDEKLRFEEIGPYVYKEIRTNRNITYNENGTMTYEPITKVYFMPEKSFGDVYTDKMVTINIPLLGIISMNSDASTIRRWGVNVLSTGSPAFVNLPVNDFLWGYDDPLVKLTSNYLPNWIDFKKFGILDRLYAEKQELITVNLNESAGHPYTIQYWDGSPGLKQWKFKDLNTSLPCNTVKGAFEGLVLPPNMDPKIKINLYKRLFCRALNIEYKSSKIEPNGMESRTYAIPENELSCSNPNNTCFCPKNGPCLPDNFIDVAPCYYGLPLAISFPHFLHSDPRLLEMFEGLNPNEDIHSTSFTYEPNLGLPLYGAIRTQVNLVMRNTMYNAKGKRFNDLTIPIIWLDSTITELPLYLQLLVLLGFKYMPVILVIVGWLMVIAGVICIFYNSVTFVQVKRPDNPNFRNEANSHFLENVLYDEYPVKKTKVELIEEETKSFI